MICPDCRKGVLDNGKTIECRSCRRDFKIVKGIPMILPKKLSSFKETEIKFYEKEFKGKKWKENFGFVAHDWDKNSFGLLDFMDAFEDLPKNARILEIGAGNGQYSLILMKRGFRNTITSDISINGLIAAKRYSKNKGEFIVSDSENIPFEDNTFDAVFLTASLHHFPDPEKAISEMRRCAKKGGIIVVAVEPNSWYFYVVRPIAKFLKIRRIDKSKDSFSIGDEATHGFSMRTLKRYFRNNNIKTIKAQRVWYLTGLVYYLPDLINRISGKSISISQKIRKVTLKIDKIISIIPIINYFSFHNTIIGVKR